MIEYWERFKGGPTLPPSERIHVTLNHRHVITMNRNAFKLLGSPRAAILYFNKKESVIGISSSHPEIKDSFPVVDKGAYWLINAAPFCRHFGIKVSTTEAFNNINISDEGILRLDLKTTTTVGRGRKREARAKV